MVDMTVDFSCSPCSTDQRGFSLAELVIVIVLIGVLASVAGPRIVGGHAAQTEGFYRELTAAVRYAQKLAVATQCEVQVNIDAGTDTYALFFPNDADADSSTCDGSAAGFGTNPVPSPALDGSFQGGTPKGVDITGGLVFFYDAVGRPSASGAVSLAGTRVLTLTVEPETGFVH